MYWDFNKLIQAFNNVPYEGSIFTMIFFPLVTWNNYLPISSFDRTDHFKSDSRVFLYLHLPFSLSFKPLRLGQDVDVAVLRFKFGHHQNMSPKIYTGLSRNKIWHQWANSFYPFAPLLEGWGLSSRGRYSSSSPPDFKVSKLIDEILTWLGKASFPRFSSKSSSLNLKTAF